MTNELFFNIFELVLAFIVILALFNFVNGVVKQTIFEKDYLARDLALLVSTLYAAPGQVTYSYNENSKDSSFVSAFMQNKVEVYEKGEAEQSRISYPFAENKNIMFRYNSLENDKGAVSIEFHKSDNSISVTK